jgi:predicted permease
LTLALGIGANTAVFSVVRGVILRPLPYGNGERVTLVWGSNPERGWLRFGASLQDFEDWREESRTLENMAAYWVGRGNLSGGDRPERVAYAMVSPSMFSALGTSPIIGRALRTDENLPGNDGVVVVSYEFWQRALGGRGDVVGQTVFLDSRPLEVVGVMPSGFRFPSANVDLWKTFGRPADEMGGRGARWVGVVAELAPGRTLSEASAEMEAIAQRLASAYPKTNSDWRVFLEPLRASIVSDVKPILLLIWASIGLVLLIACVNVANLLLARSTRRERELAIRAAIGAGRGRLVRQLLTESLAISTVGGALGLALAALIIPVFVRAAPSGIPRIDELGIDPAVLGYSVALIVVTGLLFGALPAYRASERAPAEALKEGARGSVGAGRNRVRSTLVIAELALALVVLAGAGLMVRSFARLLTVDPGFESERRLTLRVAPSMKALPERDQAVAFYDELIERMEGLPGASAVAAINVLPVSGSWWFSSFWMEGQTFEPDDQPVASVRVVSGDYFRAIGIPVLQGRTFSPSDDANNQYAIVIDRSAAQRYWPNEDPIGRRISFNRQPDPQARWYTIVGVVGQVRHNALDIAPTPMAYMTLPQAEFGHFQDWGMSLVVHTEREPEALAGEARSAIAQLAPQLPVFSIRSLQEVVASNVADRRFTMVLLGSFAVVALLLAGIGVYGVLSYMVAERTREIGMRMALGADRRQVLGWILARGMLIAGVGLGVGLALALATTRLMSGLLFEIGGTDPITFAGITLVLATVALGACAVPALKATRVDPMVALRED